MFARGALGCAAVCALLAAAVRSTPAQGQTDHGERLMNANCLACHDIRRIQTQAMDLDSWTKIVGTMVEKGAKVSIEELPVLAAYLAAQQGPLPDGPGKAIVLNTCTLCHDLRRIRRGRRSPDEWEETLNAMLNEGAPLSEDGIPVVHAYLSRHFGVD